MEFQGSTTQIDEYKEMILSKHKREHWLRRDAERKEWNQTPKHTMKPKILKMLADNEVDQELYDSLVLLNVLGIMTEFSCAGVSVLDEPEDHSLYAYVTFLKTDRSTDFVEYLMKRMRHRLLLTYEPMKNRYDISSFFINHNRSFCLLLKKYARMYSQV
jgi:hypothetical protein